MSYFQTQIHFKLFSSIDNNLFVSKQDSDSEESKGNGAPATKDNVIGGGGLFDNDDEDEDDFFSGNGLKKPNSG